MPVYFKHTEGGKRNQIESFEKDRIRIGRQPDNDLKFDPQQDLAVSGYHAEIYRDGEAFFLKDLQSRNGTFVNSRKVDQPVPLNDGDILQFSSRGPKIVFSTKDPSVETGTVALEAERISPAEGSRPDRWRVTSLVALAAASLLALLGVGLFLGWSWWVLLIVASVVLLSVGGGIVAWRLWKRRLAIREQQEIARQEREVSLGRGDKDNLQDLKQKWANVLRTLRGSSLQRLGEEPIYALPWFLVLGERRCGKSAFIKTGGPLSSVVSQGKDVSTRNCDWWFFNKLVLLDTSGRYALGLKDDVKAEWQEVLELLRHHRHREPINGAIVTLGADSLASRSVERLKEEAAELRQRLDEMVQQLGVRFPVYLLLSKCDLITGFNEFFESLPDSVKGQAMGYVNSDSASLTDVSGFLEKGFRTLCERANHLRLALIAEEERDDAARQLFLFPAELRSLHEPLKAFVEVLFRPSPYRESLFFRGLFFTSARQEGAPSSRLSRSLGLNYARLEPAGMSRDIFSRDLFSVILPNDRALTRRTALWRERYQLAQAAGLIIAVTASLLFSGLFTLSFTSNKLALSRLDLTSCLSASVSPLAGKIAESLKPLDGCRQTIETLNPRSLWKRIALDFGLRQTHKIGRALQQRFLKAFRSGVLDPLDARIDQRLAAGSEASLLVGAVLQRIHLLERCQEGGRCPDPEKWDLPNYRVMLSVEDPGLKGGDPAVDRLRKTHESYLLWQTGPKVYEEMHAKDMERIRRWLASGGLKEESILQSARAQFPPVQVHDFWGVNLPMQVDAAYTARAWREGIRPLISGLQKMGTDATDVNEAVKKFDVAYRNQVLRQWGEFLAEFPQAEKLARGRGASRELALKVLGPESPYQRVIESANTNLDVILGSAVKGSELPPWGAMLKQYAALKRKVIEAQKSAKQSAEEKNQGKEREAQGYLSSYFDALSQLRAELSTTEKSFRSAQKAFEEGEPTSKAVHPVLRASWNLSMLRSSVGFPQDEDRVFWILLSRPVALAWKAMLEEAGGYLQQQWEGLLLELIDLPPGPKGGKIIAFVNGSAAAFVERQGNRYAPRRLLDQNVPFTDAFIQYISRLGSYSPQSPLVMEPPPRIVRIS